MLISSSLSFLIEQLNLLFYFLVLPTGFIITQETFFIASITLTFEWNTPTEFSGPETIVENYTLSIRNTAMSSYLVDEIVSTPWNVTDLSYNVEYEITLTYCAGESIIYYYGE